MKKCDKIRQLSKFYKELFQTTYLNENYLSFLNIIPKDSFNTNFNILLSFKYIKHINDQIEKLSFYKDIKSALCQNIENLVTPKLGSDNLFQTLQCNFLFIVFYFVDNSIFKRIYKRN